MSEFGLKHGDRVVITLKGSSDKKKFRAVYLGVVAGASDRSGRRMFAVDTSHRDPWNLLMETQIETADLYDFFVPFDSIFDILVDECGAQERQREDVLYFLCNHETHLGEHRFIGNLGSGGKLYVKGQFDVTEDDLSIRVGYYAEHKTPKREAAVSRANERLKVLLEGRRKESRPARESS